MAATTPMLGGMTVNASAYPQAGGSRVDASKLVDSFTGYPAAVQAQKWFWQEAEWPASVPTQMLQLSKLGCKIILMFKPDRGMLPSEKTNLTNACNMFLAAGIDVEVVIWQESADNDPQTGLPFFPDGPGCGSIRRNGTQKPRIAPTETMISVIVLSC